MPSSSDIIPFPFNLDNSTEQKAEITSQETSDERNEHEFKDVNIKEEVTEQKPVEEVEKRATDIRVFNKNIVNLTFMEMLQDSQVNQLL